MFLGAAKAKAPVMTPIRTPPAVKGLDSKWSTVLIAIGGAMVGFAVLYFFGAFEEEAKKDEQIDTWSW